MLIFALFCLLAVGSQAKPLEPAQHIVIVTPQAQVHLEPAVRYVHGLSPLARVSGPHHEETIVYVPAGTAASVVPTVADTVGTGRARYQAPEGKQIENVPAGITQIQQQAQQGVEIVSGQFGEAAAAAAAAGAGFFPAFFPGGSAKEQEQQQLKTEKIELIETPANTQPLIATAEARHFYSLPQVYHTPVVDVVHTPVYTWPISTIRARSIQIEPKSAEPEPEAAPAPAPAAAPAPAPAPAPVAPPAAEAIAPELPLAQPLLKEQKLPEQAEQPLEQQQQQTIIPAAIIEASESKAEIAGRQLEEINAIKQEQTIAEIPQAIKESLKDPLKGQPIKELLKELPKEELPIKEEPKQLQLQEPQQPLLKAAPIPEAPIAEPAAQAPAQPEALPANEIIKPAPEA